MQENQGQLVNKIEAVLFYLAEPVSIDFLAKTLDISKEDVLVATKSLAESLSERGVRLVVHNDEVLITTAPEYSETIEKIIKEEREKDLGKSGIETLSIIAYKGPVSKKEIEYIRGVNSQYSLRNLLLRGLIEKKNSETDMRVIGYNITADALRFLGLSHISELPEYNELRQQLDVAEEKEEDLDTANN
ncbi:MAG: Segregation and condensation protein B [Parcubacteria group bacterium GW2011_GWF2_40_69]|nr:MAG: Segregation and condensation protein B [Parcubacteria group bacterium GW2011_GWC1_39_12]KKR19692.1 MAG: Segregation and condensation protein B [Parcubacteria group bacterium GW2011_GWF1_39_37]KKR35848.1 MAG: Segregation and condensation protein B [Parcubacteria group bacterium GW2011_GWC2_40_10]KKR52660.1 MAG: Segregation and condensation protein B [Parcubacteria group bacterium GW2011_GWE1_40_20]KKR66522.1 MAG: Segregation and condensation protein B [Parcubacteria group bacterium GW201